MLPKLKSLSSIFENVILRIPDYQRGYSWDSKQLNDLWNDLRNINPLTYHFTGILTFEKANNTTIGRWNKEFECNDNYEITIESKPYVPYFIVDGQQRLVSIIILVSLLKNELKEITESEKQLISAKYISLGANGSRKYLFGYEKDTPSHQYLIGKIFGDPMMQVTEPETIYTHNLQKAKEFFMEKLAGLDELKKASLYKKITNNLLFNVFEIESQYVDMSLVFETLNYRGKQLSKLELFKNRLIFLITKRHVPAKSTELRHRIIQTWQDIYEWLGKNPKSKLNDDEFLRAFWIMYFEHDDAKEEDFKKFEQDIFDNKYKITEIKENEFLAEHQIAQLLKCLSNAIRFWFFIHHPDTSVKDFTLNRGIRSQLRKLSRNRYGEFLKPLILAYFIKAKDEEEIETVLKAIERHNFCVYLLFGKQADTNRPHFFRLVNRFFRPQPSMLHFMILTELRQKTQEHMNFNNIFNHIHRNRANNQKFYDWNGIKYFLWEWEEYLRQNRNHLINGYSKSEIDVIFPEENMRLRSDTSFAGVKKQRPQDSLNKLCYSLGNITITQNWRVPKPYPENRKRLFEGSYSDRHIASNFLNWTDHSIQVRGLQMLCFIETHWNIRIGDEAQKKRLLLDGVLI